ncbi:MAG TPA: hypothetical protein VE008_14115 [Burkholderiales bacterium]|nr:hypothetical protein [Burkholderiales bacterium]
MRSPFEWHVPRLSKNPKRRDMRKMTMHALRRVIALAEYSVMGEHPAVPPADVEYARAYAFTSARLWFDGAMRSARLCRSEEEIVQLLFDDPLLRAISGAPSPLADFQLGYLSSARKGGAPQKN